MNEEGHPLRLLCLFFSPRRTSILKYYERVKHLRVYSELQIDGVAARGCSGAGACPGDDPLGTDGTKRKANNAEDTIHAAW